MLSAGCTGSCTLLCHAPGGFHPLQLSAVRNCRWTAAHTRAGFAPRCHGVALRASAAKTAQPASHAADVGWRGVHHVGFLVESLERSKAFYEDTLGLEINPDRPDDKLPFRGVFYWLGPDMLHLMELPNPDPKEGRADHGGRDRHMCVGVASIDALEKRLKIAGIDYTRSKSGRKAVFFRDPDQNTLECFEAEPWR